MAPAESDAPRVEAMGPDSPELQPEVIDAEARSEALSDTLSGALDVHGVINDIQQEMAQGRSGAEATIRALARTGASNAISESVNGITEMSGTMAASGMLPQGINNLMPDQMAANTIGTGMDGWSAIGQSALTSLDQGELDTTALDQFTDSLLQRPGADPFRGAAESARLLDEEMARAGDDLGQMVENLRGDIGRMDLSDVGEAALEDATQFQGEVAAGQHNQMLQGWNEAFEVAADFTYADNPGEQAAQFAEDSATTAEVLVDDLFNGGETYGGMGGDFWTDVAEHNNAVVRDIPVVGTVFDGYAGIASGIEEQGVAGFSTEMYEGASALYAEGQELAAETAQQANDAAFDGMLAAYDYVLGNW